MLSTSQTSWVIIIVSMIVLVTVNGIIYDITGINIYSMAIGILFAMYVQPAVLRKLRERRMNNE